MLKVSEILRVKGNALFTTTPDTPVTVAIQTMSEQDIGSLVIMEAGMLVGMLTFREIIRHMHKSGGALADSATIRGIMDDAPVSVTPNTSADEVQRLMLEKQTGFPSLAVTARALHVAPRTLHRRLEDEGTSFKALLEGVRHTLALAHLRQGRYTVDEIAYALGYTDTANFRRAFRRWESKPPSAFRPLSGDQQGRPAGRQRR